MKWVVRAYDALIDGALKLGNVLVAGIFLAIVYDVAQRSVGLRPPAWTSALSEYAMLYMTMLAAPALVRQGGHVAVDSFLARLRPGGRWWVERLIYLACIAICLLLAWYGGSMTWDAASRGEMDVRSIELPRWALVGILPVGFVLCAVEFARLLGATTAPQAPAIDEGANTHANEQGGARS